MSMDRPRLSDAAAQIASSGSSRETGEDRHVFGTIHRTCGSCPSGEAAARMRGAGTGMQRLILAVGHERAKMIYCMRRVCSTAAVKPSAIASAIGESFIAFSPAAVVPA